MDSVMQACQWGRAQVCDFGLARPSFNDMPTTIFWTDYVATRWWGPDPP